MCFNRIFLVNFATMKSLIFLSLMSIGSLVRAQSITVDDLKFLYRNSETAAFQYLKNKKGNWVKGSHPEFERRSPQSIWWTTSTGHLISIGKETGGDERANIHVVTSSIDATRILRDSIIKSGMKSVGESATYTDGLYFVTFNAVNDLEGNPVFSIMFAKRKFFNFQLRE